MCLGNSGGDKELHLPSSGKGLEDDRMARTNNKRITSRERHLLRRCADSLRRLVRYVEDVNGKLVLLTAAGDIEAYLFETRYPRGAEKAAGEPQDQPLLPYLDDD